MLKEQRETNRLNRLLANLHMHHNYASYTARFKANVGSRVVVAPGWRETRQIITANRLVKKF